MTKKDLLQRFIFDNAPVRGEIVHLDESFQTIVDQHDYPQPVRHLLGEALCVAALLSAIIKFEGRLTVQFRGKGALKLLLAQCDNQNRLRGLVKWDGDLTYEELMDAFQEGVLVIMLDSGANKTRYQGIVNWQGNSLAESIEGYFMHSEQLTTKIWLAVNKKAAAGFLLQVVPGTDKQFGSMQSEIVQPEWERLTKPIILPSSLLLRSDPETLLTQLFPEEAVRVFPEMQITFGCTCSRARSIDAIKILGQEEAEEELEGKQTIVVTCDFCNKQYVFDKEDVRAIFEDETKPPNTQLH